MKLSDLLTPNLIRLSLSSENKYQAIEELVGCLAANDCLKNRSLALDDVIEREQYLSTGLENGLAVPHGKTKGVDKLVMALGITKEGIDFDSLDGKTSHLIFLLLSPKDTSGPHIRALAQITRKLKDAKTRQDLIGADTVQDVMDIFTELDNESE